MYRLKPSVERIRSAAALAQAGAIGLMLLPMAADAQMNRSRGNFSSSYSAPQYRIFEPSTNQFSRDNYRDLGLPGTQSFQNLQNRGRFDNSQIIIQGRGNDGVDYGSVYRQNNSGLNSFDYGRGYGHVADRLNTRSVGPERYVVTESPRISRFSSERAYGGIGVGTPATRSFQNGFNRRPGFGGGGFHEGWWRPRHHAFYGWSFSFFLDGWAFYPYYYPTFVVGVSYPSLYGCYYGVLPPYIAADNVYLTPPQVIYVPYPVYTDAGSYQGWRDDGYSKVPTAVPDKDTPKKDEDNGYRITESTKQTDGDMAAAGADEPDSEASAESAAKPDKAVSAESAKKSDKSLVADPAKKTDKDLDAAIRDISTAWHTGNTDLLSQYIRPDARIAVYLRGIYQYSMDAGDYMDMTRDAFSTMTTVRFELNDVLLKAPGVYSVSGRHVYRNNDGSRRTVYVSFVLEKKAGRFVITQVGTAPDKIEEQ